MNNSSKQPQLTPGCHAHRAHLLTCSISGCVACHAASHTHIGAITSGELTHRYLSTRPTPWWQALGRRCIHMTWSSRGSISLEGLGLEVREGVEEGKSVE